MSQLGAPAHETWAPTAQTTSASSAPISAMATEVASARDEGDALELGEDLGDDGSGNEDGCAASLQTEHAYADIQELSAAAMMVFERWRCQQLACCDAPEETSQNSMENASAPSAPPAVAHVESTVVQPAHEHVRNENDGQGASDDKQGNEDGCAASLQTEPAYADIQELSAAAMMVFERWRCQQLACCDAPEETSQNSMDNASAPSAPPAVAHVENDGHGASVATGLENDRVRFIRPVPANVVQASRLWDSSLLPANGESSLVDKLLVSAGCSQVLPGVVDIARYTDIEGALCEGSLRKAGLAHMASRLDMWPSAVARIHALDRVPNVLKHYDL